MKKILFLTNFPAPYRVEFFGELGKAVDLTVLYEISAGKDRDSKWKIDAQDTFKAVKLKSWFEKTDSAFCPEVMKWLKEFRNDIIIVGGYSTPTGMLAISYLHQKKIPFILNCDGGMVKQDKPYVRMIKEHFISKASAWLSTGKSCDEYLIHYGADNSRIYRYSFTSISDKDILQKPLKKEEKEVLKKELGIYEKNVIIAVGQFINRKGFDVLLKAMPFVQENCGVYIVGGEGTEEYKKIVEQFGLQHIHFCEFMDKSRLMQYYRMADVFVLPTREDIWGLVVNEAMSQGLPVITTEKCVAGIELIENGKSGYIVPVDDEKRLAEKIDFILENEDIRYKMSENALQKIKTYTIENMVKEHIEIIKRVSADCKGK